jgi:hypothetical protein
MKIQESLGSQDLTRDGVAATEASFRLTTCAKAVYGGPP